MTTKIDEVFERAVKEQGLTRGFGSDCFRSGYLAALSDVRAGMKSVRPDAAGPTPVSWVECLSVMEERLDALGKETA